MHGTYAVKRRKPTLDNVTGEKPGPKPKITDADVRAKAIRGFAKNGVPLKEIAQYMSCSVAFLKKHHAKDIECGREIANALVAENLYQQAMKDSPSSINAAMFIVKSKMGWHDKKDDESRNPPQIVFNFSDLTYEERMKLMHRIKVKTGRATPEEIEAEYSVEEEEE